TTTDIAVTSVANSTSVVVTQSPAAPIFGETVTLFVSVGVAGAQGTSPSGTVSFSAGSTALGSATLANGNATFSTALAAGLHTITIDYSGDADDRPSSAELPLTISQATPTLTWANPANIITGTSLGAAQLDATASFGGTPVVGVFTYSPPIGTILPAGENQ